MLGEWLFVKNLATNSNQDIVIAIIVAIVILIACSAFFSSSETAFSTVNVIRLKGLIEEKKSAKKALWIAENFDRTVTTILVGNNFVNILATTLATVLFNVLIPSNEALANILNTIIMTIVVLIFGEILPKCLAKENSEKICLIYSGPLFVLIKVLAPIVWLFMGLRKVLTKGAVKEETVSVTEEELETIIDTMVDEGEIDEEDAELIHGMIDTNTRTVYDIMVPRVDMVAIEENYSIEQIKEIFFEYKFSRVPVYHEDKDHIIGVLNERDFFTALLKNNEIDLKKMCSAPVYVSKSMKVDDLIRKMQQEKKHFAIVADEYGGTSGIVTMEDAIEVITGEIYDEHDDIEDIIEEIKKIDDNKYILDSEMPLEDLYEMLELGKIPDSRYSNVGGFLYGLAEELPVVNQKFEVISKSFGQDEDGMTIDKIYKLSFEIIEMAERRIKTVSLEITEIEEEDIESEEE